MAAGRSRSDRTRCPGRGSSASVARTPSSPRRASSGSPTPGPCTSNCAPHSRPKGAPPDRERDAMSRASAEDPMGYTEVRVVDDSIFLFGLDALYRCQMKRHESGELLGSARAVSRTLGLEPADAPIEGYYTETPLLEEYFRRMRALPSEPPLPPPALPSSPPSHRLA